MKRIYPLILAIMIMAGPVFPTDMSNFGPGSPALSMISTGTVIDQETVQFLKVKEYVFNREWEKAKRGMRRYLDKYPAGKYRDEGLYWYAQCLNRLSVGMQTLSSVLKNKEEAFDKLNHLVREYPESLWIDDARMLRMEIAGDLALMGDADHRERIRPFAEKENKDLDALKRIGINHLNNLEAVTSISVLKKILKQEKNKDVRRKVILQIGWHHPESSVDLLQDIAENDEDAQTRQQVRFLLDRIQMDAIPVHMNYYCFEAKLTHREEQKRISEDRVELIELPRSASGSFKKVEKTLKQVFNNRLKKVKLAGFSQGGFLSRGLMQNPFLAPFEVGWTITGDILELHNVEYLKGKKITLNQSLEKTIPYQFDIGEDLAVSVYHNVAGFQFGILGEGFEKTYDSISGKMVVQNKKKDKDYKVPFQVDASGDKLLAIRDGSRVALMVIQFEADDEAGTILADMDKEPIYHTRFNNVMGCTVHSSRQTWDAGEMNRSDDGVMDYGKAKAVIPVKSGKWKLIGHILSDSRKKRFIGRAAVLIDPRGKEVARAGQIIVPVDKPGKYKVKE